jgi:hypothetical protein
MYILGLEWCFRNTGVVPAYGLSLVDNQGHGRDLILLHSDIVQKAL